MVQLQRHFHQDLNLNKETKMKQCLSHDFVICFTNVNANYCSISSSTSFPYPEMYFFFKSVNNNSDYCGKSNFF